MVRQAYHVRFYLFISVLLHCLVILPFLFSWHFPQTQWGGGQEQITVHLLPGIPGGPSSPSTQGSLEKMGEPSAKKSSQQVRQPVFGEKQGTSSGQGQSPTPAGGKGEGDAPVIGGDPTILEKIRQKILRAKQYPLQAKRRHVEGEVEVVFQINPDGSLAQAHVARSSGESILDEESLATLRRSAPYPYYPGSIQLLLKFALQE